MKENELFFNIKQKLKNNKQQTLNTLIINFKEKKYREPYTAIAILLILKSYMENKLEINFHLFNHYLMIGLYAEADKLLDNIFGSIDFFTDIIKDYQLKCNNSEVLKNHVINNKKNNAHRFLIDMNNRIDNSKDYFKLSQLIIPFDMSLSNYYFEKSIDKLNILRKNMLVLKYAKTIEYYTDIDKSVKFMEYWIEKTSKKNSIPILYKLASYYEKHDTDIAIEYFSIIIKNQPDYLDTLDRYNYLTKHQKQCKMKKYDKEDIYFS